MDDMLSGDMQPKQTVEEESLFYKINYRLGRLYEVMQENKNSIAKERADLQELISDISHPVSYTHLDVYKRQQQSYGGKFQQSAAAVFAWCRLAVGPRFVNRRKGRPNGRPQCVEKASQSSRPQVRIK